MVRKAAKERETTSTILSYSPSKSTSKVGAGAKKGKLKPVPSGGIRPKKKKKPLSANAQRRYTTTVVRSGEDLADVAGRTLGDRNRIGDILNYNNELKFVTGGTILRIPRYNAPEMRPSAFSPLSIPKTPAYKPRGPLEAVTGAFAQAGRALGSIAGSLPAVPGALERNLRGPYYEQNQQFRQRLGAAITGAIQPAAVPTTTPTVVPGTQPVVPRPIDMNDAYRARAVAANWYDVTQTLNAGNLPLVIYEETAAQLGIDTGILEEQGYTWDENTHKWISPEFFKAEESQPDFSGGGGARNAYSYGWGGGGGGRRGGYTPMGFAPERGLGGYMNGFGLVSWRI